MIQQICLTKSKRHASPELDQPMELLIKPDDYKKFKGALKVLFDKDSVQRIKRERRR